MKCHFILQVDYHGPRVRYCTSNRQNNVEVHFEPETSSEIVTERIAKFVDVLVNSKEIIDGELLLYGWIQNKNIIELLQESHLL